MSKGSSSSSSAHFEQQLPKQRIDSVVAFHSLSVRLAAVLACTCALQALTACSSDGSRADSPTSESVVRGMHDSLSNDLQALKAAAQAMQAAAPTPADRGWDPTLDRDAISATQAAWQDARTAYEHTEGALAPIFPDLDFSIDARYDDYLAELPQGDPDLFDDMGVTGLHGAERVLYSASIPEKVVTFEASLQGYAPAAYPATAEQSANFKALLLGKIVRDADQFLSGWSNSRNINLSEAFQGLVSLMNEQREKVNKAATGEEESRYSQRTMVDIRDNLAGTKKIYAVFQPYLRSKTNPMDPTLDGPTVDAAIEAEFAKLDALYAQVEGDAIPTPPATWSSEAPSTADLDSDFGRLYSGIRAAVSSDDPDSVVVNMNRAASVMGFDEFAP
jgi:iron uptake system component EfeO